MNFDWKLTDHQLIIEWDNDFTEYIFIEELEAFAMQESRLFTTRSNYKEGEFISEEVIPITFDDYLRTLNKFEIEMFLNLRRYGLDH